MVQAIQHVVHASDIGYALEGSDHGSQRTPGGLSVSAVIGVFAGGQIDPLELLISVPAPVIAASGGCLITETAPPTERYTSLAAFERCVAHTATDLLRGTR